MNEKPAFNLPGNLTNGRLENLIKSGSFSDHGIIRDWVTFIAINNTPQRILTEILKESDFCLRGLYSGAFLQITGDYGPIDNEPLAGLGATLEEPLEKRKPSHLMFSQLKDPLDEQTIGKLSEDKQKAGFSIFDRATYKILILTGFLERALDYAASKGAFQEVVDLVEPIEDRLKEKYSPFILSKVVPKLNVLINRAADLMKARGDGQLEIDLYLKNGKSSEVVYKEHVTAANLAKKIGFNERALEIYDQIASRLEPEVAFEALTLAARMGRLDYVTHFCNLDSFKGSIHPNYMQRCKNWAQGVLGIPLKRDLWNAKDDPERVQRLREEGDLSLDDIALLSANEGYTSAAILFYTKEISEYLHNRNKSTNFQDTKNNQPALEWHYLQNTFALRFMTEEFLRESNLNNLSRDEQIRIACLIREEHPNSNLIEFLGLKEPAKAEIAIYFGEHEKAADYYEKVGLFEQAADILEPSEKAVNLYVRAGKIVDAARMAQKLGLSDKVTELCKEMTNPADVAEFKLVSGEYSEAIELYEKAGRFYKAATIARNWGDSKRAIKLYERAIDEVLVPSGQFDGAIHVAEEALMTHKIPDIKAVRTKVLERAGRFNELAYCAINDKDELFAVQYFFKDGSREWAIEYALSIPEVKKVLKWHGVHF